MNQYWRARKLRGPAARRSSWRQFADYGFTFGLFLLLAFLVAHLDARGRRNETGVATVVDGDTIRLGGKRVRLRGIDAPEYDQFCRKDDADYACGRQARQALVRLIAGHAVSCGGSRLDRYGRLLGDCRAGSADLNRRLVADGWAVAYGDFAQEEAAARAGRRGIWAGSFERPQDWRRRHDRPDAGSEMRGHATPSLLMRLLELFRWA